MRRPSLTAVLALALIAATALVVVLVRRLDALSVAYSRVRTLASTLHGGSVVPAFQTTTTTGDSVTVGESADSNARQVVFMLTTSCSYCKATLPIWARMADSLRKPGVTRVQVIALSLDSLDKSRRYAEEHQLRYPMATFPTAKIKRLYRANLVPTTAILDHEGRVLYAHVGLLDNPAVLDSLPGGSGPHSRASACCGRSARGSTQPVNPVGNYPQILIPGGCMPERVKKVPAWLFGLAIIGALAFGAQRAMATPAFDTCNNPPYNGGTCTTQSSCNDNCIAIFGTGGFEQARCQGTCCECLL